MLMAPEHLRRWMPTETPAALIPRARHLQLQHRPHTALLVHLLPPPSNHSPHLITTTWRFILLRMRSLHSPAQLLNAPKATPRSRQIQLQLIVPWWREKPSLKCSAKRAGMMIYNFSNKTKSHMNVFNGELLTARNKDCSAYYYLYIKVVGCPAPRSCSFSVLHVWLESKVNYW